MGAWSEARPGPSRPGTVRPLPPRQPRPANQSSRSRPRRSACPSSRRAAPAAGPKSACSSSSRSKRSRSVGSRSLKRSHASPARASSSKRGSRSGPSSGRSSRRRSAAAGVNSSASAPTCGASHVPAVEGVRVEVAGEDHGAALAGERLADEARLHGAVRAGAVDLEVRGHRDEGRARPLDGGEEGDVPPDHALPLELHPRRAGQLEDARLADRPARQDGEAEEALLVLARPGLRAVVVAATRGLEEERREHGVHPERARQVGGHVAVPGAGHAEVRLLQQQQVGAAQAGMPEQGALDLFVLVAVLDVPLHGAHARDVDRGRRGRRGRVAPHRAQHRAQTRVEPRPVRRGAQRGQRGVRRDGPAQRAALLEQGGIAHGPGG